MIFKFIIFVLLISSINCRHLNRFQHEGGYRSPGIDAELNQAKHGNHENEIVLSPSDSNYHDAEYKKRERRQGGARDRYAIQNKKTYPPTEAPSAIIHEEQQIHFDKEIKEAKAALVVMAGYFALTFIIATAISCCAISMTVIIVSIVWSNRRTPRQPPPPPPQFMPPPPCFPPPAEMYQNDSQDMSD